MQIRVIPACKSTQLVNNARAALPDLPDGNYQARVRGIDKRGLEGKSAVHPLLIDTHPQPPVPLQPREGKILRGSSAELQWSASADAHRYQLEIATDEAFEQIVFSQADLDGTRYQTTGITEPGTYYWRVASVAADGELGPTGAARFWHLKPLPEKIAPAIEPEDDRLVASWPQVSPDQTYQVQIAFDRSFMNLEFDEITSKPSISIAKSSTQVRYLRVRSIEPDGYQGPWGTVQRIDRPSDAGVWIIPLIGVLGLLLL